MEQKKREVKTVSIKAVALLLAVTLALGAAIGGTFAWLTATSDTVTNTFVVGDIGTLTLTETTGPEYTIIPGDDIEKDPKVKYTPVAATGDIVPVDVYVFVEINAGSWGTGATENYSITGSSSGKTASWSVDTAYWSQLKDGSNSVINGVYYKELDAGDSITDQSIIEGNKITVAQELNHDDMAGLATAASDITFTAYAIQKSGENGVDFTPAQAWDKVKPTP